MTLRQFAFRNVIRNSRIYAAFVMASVSSVMVFFIYSMFMFHPKVEDEFLREVAFRGMFVAEIILVLFTLFFLFYSMSAFLQARSKEFGLLLQLGMEKRQLNRLVLIETMLIGAASIFLGIAFGYAFSKFFFMIVREILHINSLPLYFSWKPFALTIGTFTSLFVIISLMSVFFIREKKIIDLLKGYWKNDYSPTFSGWRAVLGIVLLVVSYVLAAFTSHKVIFLLAAIVPPIAALGTYFFFTDSTLFLLARLRKRKKLFWHKYRMLTVAELGVVMRENGRMFFVVSMVSTLTFLAVGTLTSMSSFSSQYHKMNPLSIVYLGNLDNPYEEMHVNSLKKELERKGLSYELVRFTVKQQTSSFTQNPVNVVRESDLNNLAFALGYPLIDLVPGEGMFLGYTEDSLSKLKERKVQTVLEENSIPLNIDQVYPKIIFSRDLIGLNPVVVSDEDFKLIDDPIQGSKPAESSMHLFAFHVPKWTETKDVGLELDEIMTDAIFNGTEDKLPFYYDNPGIIYSIIRSTFALLLFIGLLAATVFFLASGSFIYFKLYTGLERDKKQFEALKRMGLTDRELKTIVNRQLFPQFFLPWGLAILHSAFAFITLQLIWNGLAEMSIVKEIGIVFAAITSIQIVYFFLIRWRYLVHIGASS